MVRTRREKQIFFNLENYEKKKKSSIIKLVVANDECTTDPKQIMTEILNFYGSLYDTGLSDCDDISTDKFLKNINTKMLTDEQRGLLDSDITTYEYFEASKNFSEKQSTRKRCFDRGILPRLMASHMEVPCQFLTFFS